MTERTTREEKIDILTILFSKIQQVIMYNPISNQYEVMETKNLDPIKVVNNLEKTRDANGNAKFKVYFETDNKKLYERLKQINSELSKD